MRSRSGSVLIVVVGLSLLLLTSFLVINRQLRVEATDGALIQRDAQARLMLPAALCFLLEAGRLGQHVDGECFGWTDVRDGGVGPRGPRRRDGSLPPEVGGATWPAPGTSYRGASHLWERPPQAVRLTRAYNPIAVPQDWLDEYEHADEATRAGTTIGRMLDPTLGGGTEMGVVPGNDTLDAKNRDRRDHWFWSEGSPAVLLGRGLRVHWSRVWKELYRPMDEGSELHHQLLAPQPVADDLPGFQEGERRVRVGSQDLSWFRIYRERTQDHNGDGSPWFDGMALSGHGTFIVSCGAGGTRGYRDWAEVQADGAADVFLNDPAFFAELRARERILWYRVAWSGFVGGGVHTYEDKDLGFSDNIGTYRGYDTRLHTQVPARQSNDSSEVANPAIPLLNTLGTIAWIQRLDHEPTTGSAPGAGSPLW